jgi:hypothetical protein
MAITNKLECFRGEAFYPSFTLLTPEDITGWTLVMSIKEFLTDSVALVTATGAPTDAANGVFAVLLTAAQTLLAPGDYHYDIWRTNAGSECVLSIGVLKIKPEVRV